MLISLCCVRWHEVYSNVCDHENAKPHPKIYQDARTSQGIWTVHPRGVFHTHDTWDAGIPCPIGDLVACFYLIHIQYPIQCTRSSRNILFNEIEPSNNCWIIHQIWIYYTIPTILPIWCLNPPCSTTVQWKRFRSSFSYTATPTGAHRIKAAALFLSRCRGGSSLQSRCRGVCRLNLRWCWWFQISSVNWSDKKSYHNVHVTYAYIYMLPVSTYIYICIITYKYI